VESAGRIGISTGFKKFFFGVGGQFSAQAATEDADDDPAEVINHIHISDVNALPDAAGINHRVQGLRITSAIVRPTIWRYGCFRERT
jgi:hypothetical protein